MIHTLFFSSSSAQDTKRIIHSFGQQFYDVLWFLLCAIGKGFNLKKAENISI